MRLSFQEDSSGESDVLVWILTLTSEVYDMPTVDNFLSGEERRRGQTFRFAHDRARFVIGHALKRLILGKVLGVEPHALRFEAGPFGKPHLKGERLHFSLSRSGDHALLALVRDRRVGVDLEQVRPLPELDAIAARRFSAADQARLLSAGENRLTTFFDLWTGHEALLKAAGVGLGQHTPGPNGAWTYRNLALIEGYRAAIAVEGTLWSVSTHGPGDVQKLWPDLFLLSHD